MSDETSSAADRPIQLIDTVFPGDTNHHGTLFGGTALAHMDKIAFLAATRHGRAPFVTASSEKIDFAAPARVGDLIVATARVVRVGRSSLDVAVELVAEEATSTERRLCTQGRFTLVAVKGPDTTLPLPPIREGAAPQDGKLHMVDMVFPPQTNHYGTLYGGDALKMMGKAAFIAATQAPKSPPHGAARAGPEVAARRVRIRARMVSPSATLLATDAWPDGSEPPGSNAPARSGTGDPGLRPWPAAR